MKFWLVSPVVLALAACSGSEDSIRPTEVEAAAATGDYTAENPATTESCFHATDRAAQLTAGQTLLERSPDAMVRVSYNLDGRQTNHEFAIVELSPELAAQVDGAAADFFRAAGNVFDITTDDVIYDRERDGSFCAVTKVESIGRPLAEAADAVAAALAEIAE